ncbi:MAG TPA: iron-containing redox enzyme family protein [Polyangiales bacterium]|nr:iron-containing redox enzyme family protein [Polyangiales bacterium]
MKHTIESVSHEVAQALLRFPWEHKQAYAAWLAQTYFYVRHSTRLLAAAAARFSLDNRGNAFHVRFGTHIGEEKSHEKLALHDMKQLGANIQSMRELSSTRMFYETQYYKINYVDPFALYGYILMLEATGPVCGGEIVARVTRAHGPKCATFLVLHAEEDVDHVQRALAMVAELDPVTHEIVLQNLHQSATAYRLMLEEIAAEQCVAV